MSVYYVGSIPCSNELWHHGIKGQKWGVRRYQNPDGTLTEAGREKYSKMAYKATKGGLGGFKVYEKGLSLDQRNVLRNSQSRVKKAERNLTSVENEFYKNPDYYNKYIRKAAKRAYDKYGDPKLTSEDYEQYFRYDDWDQGKDSSFELFKKDNPKYAKRWEAAIKEYSDASSEKSQVALTYAKEILGKYANKKVNNANLKTWDSNKKKWVSEKIDAEKVLADILSGIAETDRKKK